MVENIWYFKNIHTGAIVDCYKATELIDKLAKEYVSYDDEYEDFVDEQLRYSPEYWSYYKGKEEMLYATNDDSPFWSDWKSDCDERAENDWFEEWMDVE